MKVNQRFIIKQVEDLKVWQRSGERAPHKPLLLLLALARLIQGYERLTPFSDLEEPLRNLLQSYGPPRTTIHPEYPFWRLQRDGLWEVPDSDALLRRASNTDPLKSELQQHHVSGGFPIPVYDQLRRSRALVSRMARMLLEANFPESLHEDILDDIGLALEDSVRRRRDPRFRIEVIKAYEYRCAVCGYDLKLGSNNLALEAAHIKWHQAGGPDSMNNGLSLCTLHHKALDRGAIGINSNMIVLISTDLHGQSWVKEWFEIFKGQKLNIPTSSEWFPKEEYLKWHFKEVFRAPAKD
jgi:putative restriction endonuclease